MYKGKEVDVKLSEDEKKVYLELNRIVSEEKQKGTESSFHQTLLRSINRIKELLKINPFAGDQVHNFQIPSKYVKKYEVENCWRIELADRWRLVYTVKGGDIEIITFVLDIINHRDYDKIFGYKH